LKNIGKNTENMGFIGEKSEKKTAKNTCKMHIKYMFHKLKKVVFINEKIQKIQKKKKENIYNYI
jgi:fructose-1-phosphate kinase PfkB-like protein